MTDPVARSDALDHNIAESQLISSLVKVGKSNRRFIRWLAASVAFDIGLSIAFAFVAFNAQKTAETATSASTQTYLQCLASNDSRAGQLKLWLYILSLPPQMKETQAQRRRQAVQAAAFKKYVEKLFAPRDCHRAQVVKPAGAAPTTSSGKSSALASPSPQPQLSPAAPVIVVTSKPTIVIVEPSSSSRPGSQPSSRASPSGHPSPSPSPTRSCLVPPVICFQPMMLWIGVL